MELTADLPSDTVDSVAVHVTPDALRQVRGGHPWVWQRSIVRTNHDGRAGDIAVIFDQRRRLAAVGLWDPTSPIAVRVLERGRSTSIDDAFLTGRLVAAFDRRRPLDADPTTTGYRLVHGENDDLAGLVIDRYDRTLVVRIDTVAWLPHLRNVIAPAVALTEAERVVVRASRRIADAFPASLIDRPTIAGGPTTGPVRFLERGLEFGADVERGQKTGFFLDQRDNRSLVASRSQGADVLDVFCHVGAFGAHAAAGGARSVHSVDVSAGAIAAAEHHMRINAERRRFRASHRATIADAFDALRRLRSDGARFDVVVVDPPAFASNAAAVPGARRAYRALARLSADLTRPGGVLFQASCSSRVTPEQFATAVRAGVGDAGRTISRSLRTAHAVDHPIGFAHGAYLKGLLLDLDVEPEGP